MLTAIRRHYDDAVVAVAVVVVVAVVAVVVALPLAASPVTHHVLLRVQLRSAKNKWETVGKKISSIFLRQTATEK